MQIGGKLLGLLVSAINEPSPAWLRSMIREHFLGNSGIYLINPLLAIIGNASSLTDVRMFLSLFSSYLTPIHSGFRAASARWTPAK